MDLLEKLKTIMKEQYRIETDEQLIEAVKQHSVDLGIFVTPYAQGDDNQ